jgi:hypothetical protein
VGGKDASGQSMFNFDVNVLDLATLKKTTVASLPFNSLAIDALGLARFISWSR